MTQPSPLYLVIETRLGEPLTDYIARNRASMSWRTMAADIKAKTGLTVNHETLRLWFVDRITIEVKVS